MVLSVSMTIHILTRYFRPAGHDPLGRRQRLHDGVGTQGRPEEGQSAISAERQYYGFGHFRLFQSARRKHRFHTWCDLVHGVCNTELSGQR